jgi:hypothetical protein
MANSFVLVKKGFGIAVVLVLVDYFLWIQVFVTMFVFQFTDSTFKGFDVSEQIRNHFDNFVISVRDTWSTNNQVVLWIV